MTLPDYTHEYISKLETRVSQLTMENKNLKAKVEHLQRQLKPQNSGSGWSAAHKDL